MNGKELDRDLIGRIFRGLREANGLKPVEMIEDFKAKTGIELQKSAVSMYERGTRIPEYALLVIFADYYNVTTDYLLGRSKTRLDVIIKSLDNISKLITGLSPEDQKKTLEYVELLKLKADQKEGT